MFRAVCFDLDGTLVGYRGDFDELLNSVRTDLGLLACDFTTFRDRLSWELRREGALTLAGALAATLGRLEQRLPPDLDEVVDRAIAGYVAQVELLTGAAELLADLKDRKVPLALLSNGPSDMQRGALKELDLERHFEAILISGDDDVGIRKPGRAIFELACRRLAVSAGEALMIGDDLEKDIEGARAVGMEAFRVSGGLAEVSEWLASRQLRPPS